MVHLLRSREPGKKVLSLLGHPGPEGHRGFYTAFYGKCLLDRDGDWLQSCRLSAQGWRQEDCCQFKASKTQKQDGVEAARVLAQRLSMAALAEDPD